MSTEKKNQPDRPEDKKRKNQVNKQIDQSAEMKTVGENYLPLIQAVADGNIIKANEIFNTAIAEKLGERLQERKIAIAQNLMGGKQVDEAKKIYTPGSKAHLERIADETAEKEAKKHKNKK